MIIGYARVSSTGQTHQIQIEKLETAGCEKIFSEKQSGKSADNRIKLQEALSHAREGDVFVVTKLDRLARSMNDLTTITDQLNNKGVGFIVTDQDIDSTTPTGKLLFNILGSLAEFERDLIKARCADGIAAAKAKGVRFGRKPTVTDEIKKQVLADLESGMSKVSVATKYQVSRQTVHRIAAEP